MRAKLFECGNRKKGGSYSQKKAPKKTIAMEGVRAELEGLEGGSSSDLRGVKDHDKRILKGVVVKKGEAVNFLSECEKCVGSIDPRCLERGGGPLCPGKPEEGKET